VLAKALFPGFGGTDFPDGLHLLAAIGFLHELVVEGVAGLFVLGGPDEGFGGGGEIAARVFVVLKRFIAISIGMVESRSGISAVAICTI